MNESGNRGGRLGRKEGRSWSLPRAYLHPVCQLHGPASCWLVTLSSLILHTQELEDEGPLLTETGCFGNPGQGASGLLGNTWEMCLQGWREVGWAVVRLGGAGRARPGLATENPGLGGGGSCLWNSLGCLLAIFQASQNPEAPGACLVRPEH